MFSLLTLFAISECTLKAHHKKNLKKKKTAKTCTQ